MSCPICNQKAANCDCTATERAQHSALEDALDEIDRLRAEVIRLREERRWIPVGERLPDSSTILASDGDVVAEVRYYAGYGWECIGGDELSFRPTHWRRLPPPPGEKEVEMEVKE